MHSASLKRGSGEAQSLVMVAKPPEADRFEAFACLKKGAKTLLPRVFQYGIGSQ